VEDFAAERKFLQHYLPYLKSMRDTELVGEFVQTLKCIGYCEADRPIKDAVDYLLSCRDESVRDFSFTSSNTRMTNV